MGGVFRHKAGSVTGQTAAIAALGLCATGGVFFSLKLSFGASACTVPGTLWVLLLGQRPAYGAPPSTRRACPDGSQELPDPFPRAFSRRRSDETGFAWGKGWVAALRSSQGWKRHEGMLHGRAACSFLSAPPVYARGIRLGIAECCGNV